MVTKMRAGVDAFAPPAPSGLGWVAYPLARRSPSPLGLGLSPRRWALALGDNLHDRTGLPSVLLYLGHPIGQVRTTYLPYH